MRLSIHNISLLVQLSSRPTQQGIVILTPAEIECVRNGSLGRFLIPHCTHADGEPVVEYNLASTSGSPLSLNHCRSKWSSLSSLALMVRSKIEVQLSTRAQSARGS